MKKTACVRGIFALILITLIIVGCPVFFAKDSSALSARVGNPYWDPEADHNYTITNDSLIKLNINDASADPDKDGLCNGDELLYGTDPYNPDTDGDGMPDGWEANPTGHLYGFSRGHLDPLDESDANDDPDGDGWTNLQEFERYYIPEYSTINDYAIYLPTDPFDPDTDGDDMIDSVDPLPHLYQRGQAEVQIRINITDFPKKIDDVHSFYVNGTVEQRLNDTSNWTAAPNTTVNIFLNETLNDTLNQTRVHWNGSRAGVGVTDENGTFNITCLTPTNVPEGMVNITGNVDSTWSNDTCLSEYHPVRIPMRINISKFPTRIDNFNNFSVNGTVRYRINETSNWTFLSNVTTKIFVNITGGGALAGVGTTDENGTFNVTCTAPLSILGGIGNITANVGAAWSNDSCPTEYYRNTIVSLLLPIVDDRGNPVKDSKTGLPMIKLSALNSTAPVFRGILVADDGDGNISTNDLPMANKTLDVYWDDVFIKTIETDMGGRIKSPIPIEGRAAIIHNLMVRFSGDKYNSFSNFTYLMIVTHPVSIALNIPTNISVEKTLEIVGTIIKDDDGYPLNLNCTNISLTSVNTMVFFDDQSYTVNLNGDGNFSQDHFIINSTTPKNHTICVSFPGISEKVGNAVIEYYSLTNFSKQIKVQRKTQIEILPQTICAKVISGRDYAGKRIYESNIVVISGSLRDNMDEPITNGTTGQIIKENTSTELNDLIKGFWGNNESDLKEIPITHNITINSTGLFSVVYSLPHNQSVGVVNLTLVFQGADYYTPCETTVQYTVKPYMDIEMKPKNVRRDENITINGTLYDSEREPLDGANITLWWDNENISVVTTDINGSFSMDYHVARNQSLGCVNITATFGGESFYDPSNLTIPYYVMSNTTVELFPKQEVIKGGIVIDGSVVDDQGTPIANGTVRLYWKWPSNVPIGSVLTDKDGRFFLLTTDTNISLRVVTICANFTGTYTHAYKVLGTGEYVHTDHKLDSNDTNIPYPYEDLTYLGNEFVYVLSQNVTNYTVWANTSLRIDTIENTIRGEQVNITGTIYEDFGGGRKQPIKDQKVTLIFDINEDGEVNNTETQTILVKTNGRLGFPVMLYNYTALKQHQLKILFDGSAKDYLKPTNATVSVEVVAHTKLVFLTSGIKEINASLNYMCDLLLINDNGEPVDNATLWVYSGINDLNFSSSVITDSDGFAYLNESVSNLTSRNYLISAAYNGSTYLYLLPTHESVKLSYTVPVKEQSLLMYILICGILGVVGGGAGVFAYWLHRRRKIFAQLASQIFGLTPKDIAARNEYIAAIFKTYQKLSRHMATLGYSRMEQQTLREFENVIKANLPLDKAHLNEFLTVLEGARYSSHYVGENERDDAIRLFGILEKNIEDYRKSLLEMEKQRKEAKLKEDVKKRAQKDGAK